MVLIKETIAMVLIGDAVLGLVRPRRGFLWPRQSGAFRPRWPQSQ